MKDFKVNFLFPDFLKTSGRYFSTAVKYVGNAITRKDRFHGKYQKVPVISQLFNF